MNGTIAALVANPVRAARTQSTNWVTVGPAEAKAILDACNHRNRPVGQRDVDAYAKDMANGHWVDDVADIVIAEDGTLANGQHVLLAVIQFGGQINVRLSVGVPKDSIYVWDTGRMRTALEAAFLAGKDIENKTVVKAFSRSHTHFTGPLWTGKIPDGGTAYSLTNQGFLAWCDENLELAIDAAAAGRKLSRDYKRQGRAGHISPTEGAMTWFILNRVDPEACGRFFELLAGSTRTGTENDPLKVLDRILAGAHMPVGYKHNFWKKVALIVITWNNWRAGKSPKPGSLPSFEIGAEFPAAL